MNKTLFFLISSVIMVIFTVITISTAPNINGGFPGQYSSTSNCDAMSESYKYNKDSTKNPTDAEKKRLDNEKERVNICYRQKAFINMEYATLIIDICLAVICSILGLFHFFETGMFFQKYTGLIGLISGVIAFVLTLVYLIYSGIVFTKDHDEHQSLLFDNGAYKKWDGTKKDYINAYTDEDEEKDQYASKAKFKDLGKKQYNYDSKAYKNYLKGDIPVEECNWDLIERSAPSAPTLDSDKGYEYETNKYCEYIWKSSSYLENLNDLSNKHLYDTWVTSLIFSAFVLVCSIGLAVFGLLIFMNPDSSGHTKL